MLFSAFCLEAYLNHLGDLRTSFWDSVKRGLSPREKLDVLCKVLSFVPDFSRRPFQTFSTIFKLRDLLVHASTERLKLEGEFILPDGESPPQPLAKWEQIISLEAAKRFLDDTEAIVVPSGNAIRDSGVFAHALDGADPASRIGSVCAILGLGWPGGPPRGR
jgi:hypothetical protein